MSASESFPSVSKSYSKQVEYGLSLLVCNFLSENYTDATFKVFSNPVKIIEDICESFREKTKKYIKPLRRIIIANWFYNLLQARPLDTIESEPEKSLFRALGYLRKQIEMLLNFETMDMAEIPGVDKLRFYEIILSGPKVELNREKVIESILSKYKGEIPINVLREELENPKNAPDDYLDKLNNTPSEALTQKLDEWSVYYFGEIEEAIFDESATNINSAAPLRDDPYFELEKYDSIRDGITFERNRIEAALKLKEMEEILNM